jgi:hypothetical protein
VVVFSSVVPVKDFDLASNSNFIRSSVLVPGLLMPGYRAAVHDPLNNHGRKSIPREEL